LVFPFFACRRRHGTRRHPCHGHFLLELNRLRRIPIPLFPKLLKLPSPLFRRLASRWRDLTPFPRTMALVSTVRSWLTLLFCLSPSLMKKNWMVPSPGIPVPRVSLDEHSRPAPPSVLRHRPFFFLVPDEIRLPATLTRASLTEAFRLCCPGVLPRVWS